MNKDLAGRGDTHLGKLLSCLGIPLRIGDIGFIDFLPSDSGNKELYTVPAKPCSPKHSMQAVSWFSKGQAKTLEVEFIATL